MRSVEVQSVAFSDDFVEVSFFEPESNTGPVKEAKTLVIPVALLEEQIADLHDSVSQLIDEALILKRNPPDRLVRGSR